MESTSDRGQVILIARPRRALQSLDLMVVAGEPGELMLAYGRRVGMESTSDHGQVILIERPRCVQQSSGLRWA